MAQDGLGRHGTHHTALGLAVVIAAFGWFALSVEADISLAKSFGEGRGLFEALFLFLRYFTILTNGWIAILMTLTAWRLWRGLPPLPASLYAAALVYAAVTGVTYEALLRRLWSPHGIQFFTDMTMHDIVPALMLVFWVGFAPKAPLAWRDPVRWLEFPTLYYVVILLSGFFIDDYPYGFLDPDKLGYPGVLANGVAFLICFYALGLAVTAAARRLGNVGVSARLRNA